MKKGNYLLLVIILPLFFSACKKYEENPEFNLTTRSHRLKGVYVLAGYYVDNIDSTAAMNADLISVYNQPFSVSFNVYEGQGIISGTVDNGTWEFLNHKKLLRIGMSLAYKPFVSHRPQDWEITKLTANQLHIKTSYNGKNYVLHLHEE